MKVARDKAIRRRMTVMQHNFGFEKPYKVLCDGNFLQAALEEKMFLKEELPKVMQAPCNPMVTNCIREELRKIGEDVSGASLIAKRFTCIRCTCKTKNARDCISGLIGEKNGDKYMVATQDIRLRRQLRDIPGVPILFVTHGKMAMESLSDVTTAAAKRQELDKCRAGESEKKMLSKRIQRLDGAPEDEPHDVAPQVAGLVDADGEGIEAGEPPKKKKKGPKGVNPLAMKKPLKQKVGTGKKRNRQHRKKGGGGGGGGCEGGEAGGH